MKKSPQPPLAVSTDNERPNPPNPLETSSWSCPVYSGSLHGAIVMAAMHSDSPVAVKSLVTDWGWSSNQDGACLKEMGRAGSKMRWAALVQVGLVQHGCNVFLKTSIGGAGSQW